MEEEGSSSLVTDNFHLTRFASVLASVAAASARSPTMINCVRHEPGTSVYTNADIHCTQSLALGYGSLALLALDLFGWTYRRLILRDYLVISILRRRNRSRIQNLLQILRRDKQCVHAGRNNRGGITGARTTCRHNAIGRPIRGRSGVVEPLGHHLGIDHAEKRPPQQQCKCRCCGSVPKQESNLQGTRTRLFEALGLRRNCNVHLGGWLHMTSVKNLLETLNSVPTT